MTDHTTTVVVALDLGPASNATLAGAVALAGGLGARLLPLHVLTDEAFEDYRRANPAGAFVDSVMEHLAGEIASAVADAGATDITEDPIVVRGEAHTAVIEAAKRHHADYLVIGIRNRSRVGKLLMGSAAQEILLDAPCPILGIPS